MKKHKILFALCLFIFSSTLSLAQNKTITYPLFESNNQFLFINKIEIENEKTVLYCKIRSFFPQDSRVMLTSHCYLLGESGKNYKLIGCDGINLDEEFYAYNPKSFSLTFEALNEDEMSFNFLDRENEKTGFILANILTYKPESVKPFICKIEGTVVGQPDCKEVQITIGDRYAEGVIIPVENGKFSYERECNFIEKSHIQTQEKNPLKSIGQFSYFYVEPGIVEITMLPKESGKKNEIKGEIINNTPDFDENVIEMPDSDKAIIEQYETLVYGVGEERVKNKSLANEIIIGAPRSLAWALPDILLSDNTNQKLRELQKLYKPFGNIFFMSPGDDFSRDSILTEVVKLELSPEFYTVEAKSIINELEKVNDRKRKRRHQYLAENVNSIKNLEHMHEDSYNYLNRYPSYFLFEYAEADKNHYQSKTDIGLKEFVHLFETAYEAIYPYHPLTVRIRKNIEDHKKRIEQAKAFFETCSKIDLRIRANQNKNIDLPEYTQLKKDIELALRKKDIESIKLIEKFANEYAVKYPTHPLTNEIKKKISIILDEKNPNKWKKVHTDNSISGLKAAIDFIKKQSDAEKEEKDQRNKSKITNRNKEF